MEISRHALVIEDDNDICELVRIVLRAEDFNVDIAYDGQEGLQMAFEKQYNLIILDLMLPKLDGWEICRRLRENPATRGIPIIMLTAKGEEEDKVLGFEVGADDYITKPFRPREFLARVNALLRRSLNYNQPEEALTFGKLTIYPHNYQVVVGDRQINLTPKEFELLALLARNTGRAFKREQLLQMVWEYDYPGSTRTVDEHVKRIRQKISLVDPDNTFIQTIWGVGYKFEVKGNAD